MSTKKGLKPFTSETGAEAGRKGGIASGESRRRKKTIRQALEALLSCRNPNNGLEGVEELALAIFEKAKEGDVRAFAEIRDSIGEKPISGMDHTSSDGSMSPRPVDLSHLSADELIRLTREAFKETASR